jgi:hypothetical protein
MDGEVKVFCDILDECLHVAVGFRSAELFDEPQYLSRNFVRATRTAFCGQKANQTGLIKVGLRFVERWTRNPEACGGLCDGVTLRAYSAQHLVANLHEIPGIEEVAARKDRIRHILRVGIARAVLHESGELRIGF